MGTQGAVEDGTRGQCRDDNDCVPWAPSCSPLGYCRWTLFSHWEMLIFFRICVLVVGAHHQHSKGNSFIIIWLPIPFQPTQCMLLQNTTLWKQGHEEIWVLVVLRDCKRIHCTLNDCTSILHSAGQLIHLPNPPICQLAHTASRLLSCLQIAASSWFFAKNWISWNWLFW